MSRTVSELEHTVVQKETEKKTLEEKSAQLREQTALLTVKQERLESSGLVSDLKQQTEMQKERVKKTAKEWAALQTVRHIIREKMERHKKSDASPSVRNRRCIIRTAYGRTLSQIVFFRG